MLLATSGILRFAHLQRSVLAFIDDASLGFVFTNGYIIHRTVLRVKLCLPCLYHFEEDLLLYRKAFHSAVAVPQCSTVRTLIHFWYARSQDLT